MLVSNNGSCERKASILSYLFDGSCSDITSQTTQAYLPVMREICGEKRSDKELYLCTHILITTLQSEFLRRDVFMQDAQIDIYDIKQREQFIEMVVEIIFK